MNEPVMLEARRVASDVTLLGAYTPIPGFGVLPVNSFVLHAQEPVLVDTGLAALEAEFMEQLHQAIDPGDLRWIWITHADADHVGNLRSVMAEAPHARLVTTYLGMGKMAMQQLPMERVYLLNPGQRLEAGDRELAAFAPPTFDAPETTGCLDQKTGTLFSADCFGALMSEPADSASAVAPGALREGCITWATVDAPWLHSVEASRLNQALTGISDLKPAAILSAHLPPAQNMTQVLLSHLAEAQRAAPFVGPDQATLERMLAA